MASFWPAMASMPRCGGANRGGFSTPRERRPERAALTALAVSAVSSSGGRQRRVEAVGIDQSERKARRLRRRLATTVDILRKGLEARKLGYRARIIGFEIDEHVKEFAPLPEQSIGRPARAGRLELGEDLPRQSLVLVSPVGLGDIAHQRHSLHDRILIEKRATRAIGIQGRRGEGEGFPREKYFHLANPSACAERRKERRRGSTREADHGSGALEPGIIRAIDGGPSPAPAPLLRADDRFGDRRRRRRAGGAGQRGGGFPGRGTDLAAPKLAFPHRS